MKLNVKSQRMFGSNAAAKNVALKVSLNVAVSVVLSVLVFISKAQANDVILNPEGLVKEKVYQLKVQFPDEMVKSISQPFQVECLPAMKGFSSWANNNTIWTYTFTGDESNSVYLEGGTKCQIRQILELKSRNGRTWKESEIKYEVQTAGPQVQSVTTPRAFYGELRDIHPIVLIQFDGQISKEKFFKEGNAYFSYASLNAPSEKIYLAEVPETEMSGFIEYYRQTEYTELNKDKSNWVLATTQQNLIPGSQIKLTVNNQVSRFDEKVIHTEMFEREFTVRSNFKAELSCSSSSARKDKCISKGTISIKLNGLVKWNDIKEAYLEFVPTGEKSNRKVQSFAQIPSERKLGLLDTFIYFLSRYVPYVAKLSDIVTDEVVFIADIQPESDAKVILPSQLMDLDQRTISQSTTQFFIKIDSLKEVIRTPKVLSYFEKSVKDLALPLGVVNLNQEMSMTRTGTKKTWEPLTDPKKMIQLIKAYSQINSYLYDENPNEYVSPLKELGQPIVNIKQKLVGDKNTRMVLKYPFNSTSADGSVKAGMYPIEITSSTFGLNQDEVVLPKHVLPQVTDLAVHFKKGSQNVLFWVTKLSTGEPVSQAQISILDCLGNQLVSLTTNKVGLAESALQESKTECTSNKSDYSSYNEKSHFFVFVKTKDDQVLSHSSWITGRGYASSAPNVSYFYSMMNDHEDYFQAVVGVNLVKPGQSVPFQVFSKRPGVNGFSEIPNKDLPTLVRVVNDYDESISFDIPVQWSSGRTQFSWQVPRADQIKLGTYRLFFVDQDKNLVNVVGSEIEIAEFKVPLMSAQINLGNKSLVRPETIPVTSRVQYANGVGASELSLDLTYFFVPTQISGEKSLLGFEFGKGEIKESFNGTESTLVQLPTEDRPTVIEDLKTSHDGTLTKDIGLELTSHGNTVLEALKSNNKPVQLVVRARYLDQSGEYQTFSQSNTILNSHKYIGAKVIPGTRELAQLQLVTIDAEKNIVTDVSDYDFKVLKIETKVVGEELFGGLIKNTFERVIKQVNWNKKCLLNKGIYSCAVGTLKSGVYALQGKLKSNQQASNIIFKIDDAGRVYSENSYSSFGDSEEPYFMTLTQNKESYKADEKATLSFSSPFKQCHTLITIERSDVISGQVVSDACEKGYVDLQLDGMLAPNVFASVLSVTGRVSATSQKIGDLDIGRPTYKIGYANLKIGWEKFRALVEVKTDKSQYEPKETVQLSIHVKPQLGKLSNGKVSIIAIEEKILELKPNETYQLLENLMQQRNHNVSFVTPLENIETAAIVNTDLPDSESGEKGGDEGGDGSSKSEFRRKLFNALVSFQSEIPIVDGIAKASFKTNDSLTKFKIFALVYDDKNKFGTGSAHYLTIKDHQVYSNIPNVARTNDRIPLIVSLQNNSSRNKIYMVKTDVVVKDSKGKILDRKTFSKSQSVNSSTAKTAEIGKIEIPENASEVEYTVSVYDEDGTLLDQIEIPRQVVSQSQPLVLKESFIEQMQSEKYEREFLKDSKDLVNQGEVNILASKSLVTSATNQIIQKMNKDPFVDLYFESRIFKALVSSSENEYSNLQELLNTMPLFMDEKGFIKSFAESQNGSVWLTAELINQLQNESWAMKLVPLKSKEKLISAISLVLNDKLDLPQVTKDKISLLTLKTMMARAGLSFSDEKLKSLSRSTLKTIQQNLLENPMYYGLAINKWPNKTLAELLMLTVMVNNNLDQKNIVYESLKNRLVYMGNGSTLSGSQVFKNYYTDETIESSLFLQALCFVKAEISLVRPLAIGVINQGANSKWYSNSSLVSVNSSLRKFAKSYEVDQVSGVLSIQLDGSNLTKQVDFSSTYAGGMIDSWISSKTSVHVQHSGKGFPWVSTEVYTVSSSKENRSEGLLIQKTIKNLNRDSGFKAGDIIQVKLKLNSANNLSQVAVSDPIPAGANFVGSIDGDISHFEKSSTALKIVVEQLNSLEIIYQYQLNNPGYFNLPATEAKAVYMSGVFADFKNESMTIE